MDGKLYYSFKAPKQSVRFFALESTYLDPEQIAWFEKELKNSDADWKIPYFHHPPVLVRRAARLGHAAARSARAALPEVQRQRRLHRTRSFLRADQAAEGIVHFVVGSGGQLRKGNIDRGSGSPRPATTPITPFMVAEINGDEMWFNAVSRQGQVIDSGVDHPEEIRRSSLLRHRCPRGRAILRSIMGPRLNCCALLLSVATAVSFAAVRERRRPLPLRRGRSRPRRRRSSPSRSRSTPTPARSRRSARGLPHMRGSTGSSRPRFPRSRRMRRPNKSTSISARSRICSSRPASGAKAR